MARWIVAIVGALVGALLTGFLLKQAGVAGFTYTALVLVGSLACSSLAGVIYNKMQSGSGGAGGPA